MTISVAPRVQDMDGGA